MVFILVGLRLHAIYIDMYNVKFLNRTTVCLESYRHLFLSKLVHYSIFHGQDYSVRLSIFGFKYTRFMHLSTRPSRGKRRR